MRDVDVQAIAQAGEIRLQVVIENCGPATFVTGIFGVGM